MTIVRLLTALAVAAALLAGCGGDDDSTSDPGVGSGDGSAEPGEGNVLTGEVSISGADELSHLPDGARVIVRLEDVSLQDAPSTEITSQTMDDVETLPVTYELAWADDLSESRMYTVAAEVWHGEELLFWTDTAHEVGPGDTVVDVTVVTAG